MYFITLCCCLLLVGLSFTIVDHDSFVDCLWSMLCFFFFKQKTAYEMRISDWSSDVCSSDLSISFHKMPENERTEYVTWALATLSKWIGIPEIGRASCRERVCQYV